jgi:hypothetical protein
VPNLLAKFFGRTASEGAAYALGVATGPVLTPSVEELKNVAWRANASKAIDPNLAAAIVAEDVEQRDWGAHEAAAHGINGANFDAILGETLNAPGFGELIRILRRHPNGGADFEHGLRKAKLEGLWDNLLADLEHERLDPAVIANAIQQGFMHNAGVLPDTPDQTPGKVTTQPPVDIDTLAEARAGGYDEDRLKVLARLAGLPPGPEALASMVFRSIIEAQDYSRGVGQGHTKNEWADAILEYSRQIPSATNFVAGHLHGWRTADEMYAGTALHGMSKPDTDLLYLISGRPVTTHQAFIGFIRGGRVEGQNWNERETFRRAVIQSNIRPEWEPILWAQRYSYPSAFVLRALTQAGDISPNEAEQVLLFSGWEPTLAAKVSTAWGAGPATTSKGLTVSDLTAEYEGLTMSRTEYVNGLKQLGYSQAAADGKVSVSDSKRRRSARNQLINRARLRYVGWHVPKQSASDALRAAGLTIGLANELLASWDIERDLNVHTLTEAQVVKAFKKAIMDRPTAVERLTELGLATSDIDTRLAEA